jgi:hypothetical protein
LSKSIPSQDGHRRKFQTVSFERENCR